MPVALASLTAAAHWRSPGSTSAISRRWAMPPSVPGSASSAASPPTPAVTARSSSPLQRRIGLTVEDRPVSVRERRSGAPRPRRRSHQRRRRAADRGTVMGERIEINGHPTWVDDRGEGGDETVLLLHGGMSNSDELPACWRSRCSSGTACRVRPAGHGYTADLGGPFHYVDMADETIGVLEEVVGVRRTSSDGVTAASSGCSSPCVGPSRARIVAIGANYHHDGMMAVDFGESTSLGQEMIEGYAERSPDGLSTSPGCSSASSPWSRPSRRWPPGTWRRSPYRRS